MKPFIYILGVPNFANYEATAGLIRVPREGGIIVAVGDSRAEIEAIMKEDPFCARGLAEVRVIEFRASQLADDIQDRIASRAG